MQFIEESYRRKNMLYNYVINICRLALKTKTVRVKEKNNMNRQSNDIAYEKNSKCYNQILIFFLWHVFCDASCSTRYLS